ncbi:MAG: integrase core domain-containing protein, partial [Candidatus Bathyarchaeia archaeon]
SHKTDDDEFYSQTDLPLDIDEANELLREWQDTYNWVRPHQGLGYLTPQEKLMQYMAQKGTPKTASHVMNQNT